MKRQANAKNKKTILTGIVILLMVGLILGIRVFKKSPAGSGPALTPYSKGSPEAAVKIDEYTDFQCPACSKGHKVLSDKIKENPNSIFVTYHPFPLTSMHPYALEAAVFAECAARQGRFWAMHDLLFENQAIWTKALNTKGSLLELGLKAGLDANKLNTCTADPETKKAVLAQKEKGAEAGVVATPTYFVNKKQVVGYQNLEKELTPLLSPKADNDKK